MKHIVDMRLLGAVSGGSVAVLVGFGGFDEWGNWTGGSGGGESGGVSGMGGGLIDQAGLNSSGAFGAIDQGNYNYFPTRAEVAPAPQEGLSPMGGFTPKGMGVGFVVEVGAEVIRRVRNILDPSDAYRHPRR